MIQIKKVSNKRSLKSFIDFPHELYKNSPNYVPELFIAQRDLLTKHPFLKNAEIALFMAFLDDKMVGRIAAIFNRNHNSFNQVNEGFFGFFDVINNLEVAKTLFEEVEKWLKTKNADTIVGPMNPSTNETCGLLIKGFDAPPVTMMTYNFPYYQTLIEELGYKKQTDLLAYIIETKDYDDKPTRLMEAFEKRLNEKGIKIRKVNLKNFDFEVENLRKVYNAAWDKNLGFVPMTDDEFRYMAKDLKLVIDPDFCLVAEKDGEAVAFSLCIPDINEVQIKVKRGRLLPTGIFKLLFGRKIIKTLRVVALGVTEPYRKMGIEAIFYGNIIKTGIKKGYTRAEASWILEDNEMMNKAMIHIHGNAYKTYRIFEKKLN